MPSSLRAQVSHPRIWLDSATMTRLLALKNANDSTWVNLKADADAYATYKVAAYSRNSCPANEICYDYEGLGWMNAIEPLALAYRLTANTRYSDKVREILNVFAAAGVTPCSAASGYASRSAVFGMALGYDWVYDQLSPTEKSNLATELNSCWDWLQTSGFEWNCSSGCPTAYGNYYGGHILGYGLAAIAMEGDNTNAPTILSAVTRSVSKYFDSSIGPPSAVGHADPQPGGFAGGFAVEGYNYGGSVFLRYIQFFQGMKTAGKADLFTQYLPWMKQVAKNTVYEARPDNWGVNDEGEWSGPHVRVLYRFFPCDLGAILTGTIEGGWMTYLCQHLDPNYGSSGVSPNFGRVSNFDRFFYNAASSGTNYNILPLNFFSPGDYHTIVRSDWTKSAVHTTVDSTSQHWADHQSNMAGHIAIQRGSDYLLVNAGMWAGQNGAVSLETGTWPQTDNPYSNWDRNTLFYWDGGAAVRGVSGCLDQDHQYAGCQGFWGVYSPVIPPSHNEGIGWTFQRADLTRAYNNNNGLTTITQYVRSFINIGGDISFVLDRITAPRTSTRQLRWHTPALTTAIPSGIATAITVGPISSVTVGSSKLWINTLLPAPPAVRNGTDELIWGRGTYSTTQGFIVSDPNASSCSINCLFLTVLAPTASSVSAMPTTTLISTTGYKGAIYNDGILPRIALFSSDGTSKKEVTYTASYSGELNGRHVITDLIPGAYTVSKDDAIVLEGQAVASDGSLSFDISGGTTFSISYTGPLVEISPPTGLTIKVH
jgi:hypothetical protein